MVPGPSPAPDERAALPTAPVRRAEPDPFATLISGDLAGPPRRRGWHLLGLATGLVLLPRALGLLGRLLGYRRRGTLRLEPPFVHLETRVALLGGTVTENDVRLHLGGVAGVAVSRAQPSLMLLAGGVIGLVVALAGLKTLADGVLVKATSLVLAGAGVLLLGLGVDLAAFALGRYLRARRGALVSVLGTGGPLLALDGIEPARAARFAQSVTTALARARDGAPESPARP
ncbi:MAG TPA: hypothetical protein VGQ83_02660 [Polyangia bacterium]|jgi:hypothetical protein